MRPTVASIDLDAIAFNLQQVKKRVYPAKVMAVVKANAYGHGAVPVARRALQEGADFLAVALLEEGIELRRAGISAPILVFGGFFPEQIREFLHYNLQFTFYSEEYLPALREAAGEMKKKPHVHIKVDTGMGRVGLNPKQALEFITRVRNTPEIDLVGLYTHFATSDERDKSYAKLQLQRFRELISRLKQRGINIPLKHAANSGAILDMPDAYFDMVRPGIMLYGYYPSTETTESTPLKPAMTFKSKVLFVKKVEAGTSVSYGRKYIAKKKTKIAAIPVGYADGYNRLLTNTGFVSIRGKNYPVAGRVCMDQILVDVGPDSPAEMGDEAVLFGPGYGDKVAVPFLCEKLSTIPYEVCCRVSSRVPRVYQ